MVQMVAGIGAVIILVVLVLRRRNKAAKPGRREK
jgi:hypothetical protein